MMHSLCAAPRPDVPFAARGCHALNNR